MNYPERIKTRLKTNAKLLCNDNPQLSGRNRETAFVFDALGMNFNSEAYNNIQTRPNWINRTQKVHTHFNDGTLEMQSSNSSDALLMNIFAHPMIQSWKGPIQLLDINSEDDIEFGWNPLFDNENPKFRTEIDMKIGSHIFEAKLTEPSFPGKEIDVVQEYEDFDIIFNQDHLLLPNGCIDNYQLIRNILTAYKYDYTFTAIIDETRVDMMRDITNTTRAIKLDTVKKRISFLTWQEIVEVCGNALRDFLQRKYFRQ